MVSPDKSLRTLSATERQLLNRLLSVDIPGRQELLVQAGQAMVGQIDSNGSLRFVVGSDVVAPVARRIPVEAQYPDSDGTWIHALLHVVDGKLRELELYKDDSSPVIRMPTQDEWEVVVVK